MTHQGGQNVDRKDAEAQRVFRAGDAVFHEPSSEFWIVAAVAGDFVYPAGWPMTRALAVDCTVTGTATDEQHRDMVERCLKLPKSDWRRVVTELQTGRR